MTVDAVLPSRRTADPAAGQRYDHVDAQRAMAVFLVIGLHFNNLFLVEYSRGEPEFIFRWLTAAVDPGRVGVVWFFAISGFVIPSSLRGPRGEGARQFVIRRFLRLYPTYWLSLLITVPLLVFYFAMNYGTGELVAQVTMVQEFLGYSSINGVAWTLHIELVFYAICLGLFLLGVLHKPRTFSSMIMLLALAAWGFERLTVHLQSLERRGLADADTSYWIGKFVIGTSAYHWDNYRFNLLIYLSIMALGALLRFWYAGKLTSWLDRMVLIGACVYWIALRAGPTVIEAFRAPKQWVTAQTYLSLSVPVLLFVVFTFGFKIRSNLLSYLGWISYSLYLFHYAVIVIALCVLRSLPALHAIPSLMWCALIVGATICFSAIVYVLIEKPAIEFGDRLAARAL